MKLRNCRKCKKLFISVSGRIICQECYEEKEKSHERVFKYLNKNPDVSIKDICEATKATEDSIVELVKNKKITLNVSVEYKCEICGKKIKVGKVCEKCKKEMSDELNKAINKVRKEEGASKARDLATKFALDLREKRKRR